MSLLVSPEVNAFAPQEFPLGEKLSAYVTALTQSASGTLVFRTGSGRILRDLLLHWPTLDDWEAEAQELCERVVDAIYPLAGSTFARGVEVTAMISSTRIDPPDRVDSMSTYVVFDPENHIERHCFLSPRHALPPASALSTPQGIVILCRPLFYRYHTMKDDRKKVGHPRVGIFELSQRQINELYERPDFITSDKVVLGNVKTKIAALAKIVQQNEDSRKITARAEQQKATAQARSAPEPLSTALLVNAAIGIYALPSAARGLLRLLMLYVMNKGYSAEVRLNLRKIAQSIRMLYPRELIDEVARCETVSPHINPSHHTVHSFRMADLKKAELALSNRHKPELNTGMYNNAAPTSIRATVPTRPPPNLSLTTPPSE